MIGSSFVTTYKRYRRSSDESYSSYSYIL